MNEIDVDWQEAVLTVLGSFHPDDVDLGTIYFEVRKYRKLSERDYEETKHGEPRYHHIVRATLTQLVKKGMVERVRRGVYVLKD